MTCFGADNNVGWIYQEGNREPPVRRPAGSVEVPGEFVAELPHLFWSTEPSDLRSAVASHCPREPEVRYSYIPSVIREQGKCCYLMTVNADQRGRAGWRKHFGIPRSSVLSKTNIKIDHSSAEGK